MDNPQQKEELDKLIQLLSELSPGVVKDELQACIHRIEERLGSRCSTLFDRLQQYGYRHAPRIGEPKITDSTQLDKWLEEKADGATFIDERMIPLHVIQWVPLRASQELSCTLNSEWTPDISKQFDSFIDQISKYSRRQDPYPSFDADRLPGPSFVPGGNLMGPEYFRRRRDEMDGSIRPSGARYDPFGPVGSFPNRSPQPRYPRPNPDYLPKPGFYDLY